MRKVIYSKNHTYKAQFVNNFKDELLFSISIFNRYSADSSFDLIASGTIDMSRSDPMDSATIGINSVTNFNGHHTNLITRSSMGVPVLSPCGLNAIGISYELIKKFANSISKDSVKSIKLNDYNKKIKIQKDKLNKLINKRNEINKNDK